MWLTIAANLNHVRNDLSFFIYFNGSVRNRVVFFFVRVEVHDVFGHYALLNFCVRRLDDAELVDA